MSKYSDLMQSESHFTSQLLGFDDEHDSQCTESAEKTNSKPQEPTVTKFEDTNICETPEAVEE